MSQKQVSKVRNYIPKILWNVITYPCPRYLSDWKILNLNIASLRHDDVNKWYIFRITGPLFGEFTGDRWIPLTKVQWRGALMFSLICARANGCANNRDTGDLKCHRGHYDVTVIKPWIQIFSDSQHHNFGVLGGLLWQQIVSFWIRCSVLSGLLWNTSYYLVG